MVATKKIYFASDVHLGHPNLMQAQWRERLFVHWLDSIKNDARAIYLVGDIFDFWFEFKKVVPRGFVRTLGKLAELSDAGIEIHLFTGNHDVWVFDYLPSEIGLTVHRKPLIQELSGKKFYMAHGDGLGPGDFGYKIMKSAFTSPVMQWIFSRLHPNFSVWLAHKTSNTSRDANGLTAQSFRGEDRELIFLHAKQVLAREYFDYLIFGHRHLALDMAIEGSRFIYLGDWLNNFSYGVFDGEGFELKKIEPNIIDYHKNKYKRNNHKRI